MQSPTLRLAVILGITATAKAAVAGCHAENCYRAMFPCASSSAWSVVSAFCATITAGYTTATNYPTRAIQACGTVPATYLSVCSCDPTCTPTSTPAPCPSLGLVPNGDFKCDTKDWTVQVPDPQAATASIVSGAGEANTGSKAFQVRTRSAPITPELGVSARITSSTISVAPNVPLALTFATFFNNGDAGFIGVLVNGAPVRTVDASDRPVGVWNDIVVDYTSATDSVVITFEFLFGPYPSIMRTDTVGLDYVS